ncbi:exopolyphosphatase [Ottowia thiooxydans]|uniref:exopolyphosphatase n=1 Tax=Ottowia thiooxydans TaxID=219182 RepID=UPI0003FECB50|nr:exopolyphosphatase [Ottowia thiooxydans]
MQTGTRLAAVDLGSNSFRLEIARLELGQIQPMEYHKETVRQGNGLDADRRLSQEAMQRGWNCLARFGERLAGFTPGQVRAVATQTLREARNREEFLVVAQQILGFPIDVISGREEARLIYQGVAHLLPQSDEKRLVIDIGGRSTEMILGQGYAAETMESYRIGSVAWSMRYFPDGALSTRSFEIAEIAAKAVLDDALTAYSRNHWEAAYGSSGTIGAVADVLQQAGRTPAEGVITREGLDWLRDRLVKAQRADAIRIEGIKDERKPVIAGGLAVLRAVFDLLGIDSMQHAHGALRHGALYDLLDREENHTDVRSSSIERLASKFNADSAQASRVGRAAVHLLGQLLPRTKKAERQASERHIEWAARLHEIGSRISHADYHKHSAYILDNADVPGFSMHEMHDLSQLVLGHRGKLRKLETRFGDELFMRQLMALRLAVIFCHARQDPDIQDIGIVADPGPAPGFTLTFRSGWADAWPQSAHLLREEVLAWQKTPWGLGLVQAAR